MNENIENEHTTKSGTGATKSTFMITAAFPGKYIQGEGVISQLPEYISLLGTKGMIISSATVKRTILDKFAREYARQGVLIEKFGGECCESELKRLYEIAKANEIDVIVAAGGGKAIDTAKIVADRAGLPVIIVPTIASTDAPISGCAVIYSEDGVFESVYYQKMNPQIVLVDMAVIANAPTRYLIAGMGDALSTWFEARSCVRTMSKNECGGYSTLAAMNIAQICYDNILKYALSAMLANDNHIITPALHHIVEANTLLSGIGFESAGLASAHAIHNGLSALEETHAYYHGEKVAFGVLAGLHLTGASPEEMNEVYTFCEVIGLPTTLEEIGLLNCSRDELMIVAIKSCAPQESMHKEAGEITPDKVLYALIAADAMGKIRKETS